MIYLFISLILAVMFPTRKLGACLLNMRREQKQNGGLMRMERLYKVMKDEYTCRLKEVIIDRN